MGASKSVEELEEICEEASVLFRKVDMNEESLSEKAKDTKPTVDLPRSGKKMGTGLRSFGKLVMVMGESGVGKSTIINMMYNQNVSDECCKGPCSTGSTANSVTKASALHFDMAHRVAFLDTVGIGDPEMTTSQIVGSIRGMLKQLNEGVHVVMVVMKMGRVTAATRANLELLRELFSTGDLKSSGVLVLTHWDGEIGEEEKDLLSWLKGDDDMKALVEVFSKVILTNNNVSRRGGYPECRRKCLTEINEVIIHNETPIYAKPTDLREMVERIIRKFAEVLWHRIPSFQTLAFMGLKAEDPIKTYVGECPVCYEQIEFEDCLVLPCHHTFHRTCQEAEKPCALCREKFDPIECWTPDK